MKYLFAARWYLAGILLGVISLIAKGAAEGKASKAMILFAQSNSAFNSGEISREELSQAREEAQMYAKQTDVLRPVSFWVLVGSAFSLLRSGCVKEPISKIFREVSIIVLVLATVMQFFLT